MSEEIDLSFSEKITTGKLLKGEEIIQTFVPDSDFLSGLAVLFSNYKERASCLLVFQLYRVLNSKSFDLLEIGKIEPIFETKLDTSICMDNDLYEFYFSPIKGSCGQKFAFRIFSPNSTKSTAVTGWVGKPQVNEDVYCETILRGSYLKSESIIFFPRYSPTTSSDDVPSKILYSPLTQCNLNCIHCISRETRKKVNKMPIDIKTAISKLVGQKKISFLASDYSGDILYADHRMGGELDYIIGLNIPFHIDTNSHYLDQERVQKLLHSKMAGINFSLDAGKSETYTIIRKGSIDLDVIKERIRYFFEQKRLISDCNIQTSLSMALMKLNLGEVEQLIDFGKEIGVGGIFLNHLQVFTDDMEKESLLNHKTLFNYRRWRISKYASKKGVEVHLPPPFVNKKKRLGHKYCSVPWTSAVILGNGDVMACCVPGTVMGNLNLQPLEEIWNGKNYKEFRRRVNSNDAPNVCNSCPYLRYDNNDTGIFFNKVDINEVQ